MARCLVPRPFARLAIPILALGISCTTALTPSLAADSSPANGAAAAGTPPPQPVDPFVTRAKAIQDVIVGTLHEIGWAIAVIVLLVMFQRPLANLLRALSRAMEDRGVTLDVGTVKVQVTERALDTAEDRGLLFSVPFDVDGDAAPERLSVLSEIPPQLQFQFSDAVAKRTARGGDTAEKVDLAYSALVTAFGQAHDFQDVRGALTAFARTLEKSRFLAAWRLAELLDQHAHLQSGLANLELPPLAASADEYLLLHAVGVAYAQRGDWGLASNALDRITWQNDQPHYLPASDAWLACSYHDHMTRSLAADAKRRLDLYLDNLVTTTGDLLTKADKLVEAMESSDWGTFPTQAHPGYYKRQIQKIIGLIASAVGEYSEDPPGALFLRAEKALRKCVQPIDNDPPSPLDHNNLADLFRQLGRYDDAHASLDIAYRETSPPQPEPTYDNTRALIFWKQKDAWSAVLALRQLREDQVRGAGDQDVDQYVENQILAAKFAVASGPVGSRPHHALAAELLEAARRFFDEAAADKRDTAARQRRGQLDDLLGFAYLALPGSESKSVEAFERLHRCDDDDVATETRWRRRIGHAKALTRLAGQQRRSFSSAAATEYRGQAAGILADSDAALKAFGLRAALPPRRKVRHLLLRLDTVVALHALAQETFQEGAGRAARELVDQEATILAHLRMTLDVDRTLQTALGSRLAEIRSQLRLSEAQRSFLLARLLVDADPGLADDGLLAKVEASFDAARGVDEELTCRTDLALGEVLLAAAMAGKGDVAALYQRAVTSFERASTRDAPSLRGETTRVLAEAYARRGSILQRAKPSKSAA